MVVLTAVVIVVGVLGTLLPVLPGIGLVWLATLAYGIVEGFGALGWAAFGLITAVGGLALWLGLRIPQKAAAEEGLPWQGQVFAVVLAVVGFFVVPVLGAAIGFVIGVFLAASAKERTLAFEQTWTTIWALLKATGVQFAAALAMSLLWVGWVTWG